MMKKTLLLLFAAILLTACWTKREEITGYAPIYGDPVQLKTISITTPQPVENGGKIYVFDHFLYQVENGKGIHITDIANPGAPQKTGFIKIMGCQELSVKNDVLFANNMNDLVALKISGQQVTLLKRLPGSFKKSFSAGRPPTAGRFECPDTSKGIVIGWQKKVLINPSCSY